MAQADPLTPRQTEVLHLLAEGMTRENIAAVLGISVNTVAHYVTRIYDALGVQIPVGPGTRRPRIAE